jgi:predicted component of type VI protein secretion system
MAAFLVPVDPGLCVIPLEKAIVLIGRQSDCDVSLTQSRKVSRRHCCLAQVNNQIIARDLGSTNGIYLNGERVKKQCRLKLGDEFMVGDLRFRLQADPKSQPGVQAAPAPARPKPVAEDAIATFSSKPTPYMRGMPGGEMPSLEIPVAIPEEGHDFVIEPSVSKMPPRRPSKDLSASSEDDVIPLGSDSAV